MPTRTAVAPPRPIDEQERLQALYRARILDSEAESAFDDLALLAAHVTGMPLASINFLDDDVQFSKASTGAERGAFAVDRDLAFCSYAILQDEPLHIPDLTRDDRTRDNPLVTAVGMHAYTGAAVRTREGFALGAVCVLDTSPRKLTATQVGALAAVARQAAVLVEWRTMRPRTATALSRRRAR